MAPVSAWLQVQPLDENGVPWGLPVRVEKTSGLTGPFPPTYYSSVSPDHYACRLQGAARCTHPAELDLWYHGELSKWRWDPEGAREREPLVLAAFRVEQTLIAAGRGLESPFEMPLGEYDDGTGDLDYGLR